VSRRDEEHSMTQSTPHLLSAVPQFAVQDVVRAAEYFRDVLGFEIASYWDGERRTMTPVAPPPFGVVFRDQVQVFFYHSDGPIQRDGGYHAYFHVRGVDALADEWRAQGAEILDGPEEMSYGQREVVIRDINGLILAFGEAPIDSDKRSV
jgi:catechol 2,3-dioxygenase-like lactoylglutathione lyase family enzyme